MGSVDSIPRVPPNTSLDHIDCLMFEAFRGTPRENQQIFTL